MSNANNRSNIDAQQSAENSVIEPKLNTPVLLMIFNKPEETKLAFEQIRQVKPQKLYIAGDGPRANIPNDQAKVEAARDYVINNIDWECKVQTLFRDTNLARREGVASTLDWFFENEESGIIINDDIIVSNEFFFYAQELLERYKDNPQIMCITADNFLNGKTYNNDSYYYSQIPHCWGWASWKRAWEKYRLVEKELPAIIEDFKSGNRVKLTHNDAANYMWQQNIINSKIDTWDYIWTFAILINSGLTCTPRVNLAKFIDCDKDSTHVKQSAKLSLINTEKFDFPLSHPKEIKCLQQADDYVYKKVFCVDEFNKTTESDDIEQSTNTINDLKPIFDANQQPIRSIYRSDAVIRESQILFSKYLRSPRYQQIVIDFLDFSFKLPDAQSFIWQFKDIFELENYKFQPKTKNPVIIDCGANVGTSCLYFAKTYPNSHIFAFEPDKKIFTYLKDNLKNNNITNVTLFNSAVWIDNCDLKFSSEGADSGTLLLSSNNMVTVKAISLNDFLSQFDYIDFLKLDIEGVEDIVIKDCLKNLHKIENLFIEYHSFYEKKQNYDEILKLLTDNNFRYYTNTANNIPNPFFNKIQYGTMDLQINIYATNLNSAANQNSTANNNSANSELQTRKQIFSILAASTKSLKLLNLGCGNNFHPKWTNIDFTATGTDVIAHNLLQGVPCDNESFDVIYHSHVLEHFPKNKAQNFINECFRVLKPGGLIRIAVPDLEQIAKLYLEKLDKAANGDTSAIDDYDWMMLELFDQTVRNQSGGDMQKYLGSDKLKNMEFIRNRIGIYADSIRNSCINSGMNTQNTQENTPACTSENYLKIGAFRMGGEVHQWMYDRFSVTRLLSNTGFKHIGVVSAYESSFEDFSRYSLDVKNGEIVKADSLFIEAVKLGLETKHVSENSTATESESNSTLFLNNGGIKVLTLSSKDSGGAGGAARRMHEALLKAGADAVMIVLDKATTSDRVAKLEIPIPNLDPKQPSAQLFYAFNIIQKRLADYPKRQIPSMFTSTESIINYAELAPFFAQADIIHLNWMDGFFDYQNAPEALKNKKIIWTLHDMYQFTGGCHYAIDCKNYINGCQNCPQLGENTSCALTQESIQIKNTAYSQLDINIVTPSKWLGDCAKQSTLMKNFPCDVIPYAFDIDLFKPVNMDEARSKFNIPKDKCIILFGADHILNYVKNLSAIINSLASLCNENRLNPDSFILVLFGAGQLPNETYPFSIQQLGTINSAADMAYVYSSADFLMLPSIADNYPNIMCEALACGTPVVGFDIGGLPDLITSEKTGYLAKPFDLKQLQQGILWGINTAKGNTEIRKKCREIIETNLNENIISNRMLTYYNEVLDKPQNTNSNNSLSNITSNDSLRKRYITKILNTQESKLVEVASIFSNEIINWLANNLLPHKNLTDEETALKQECIESLMSSSALDGEFLRALLLSIVLIPAEELPLTLDIYRQPEVIQNLLTQYIFSFKELPAYNNFAEITLEHMVTYLQMLKVECDKNPGKASNLILNTFNTLRKIPVYCAQGGLREVMELFAEIMRKLLIHNNAAVDFDFAKRDKKGKIRLGILLQAFGEHTETYATLPTFTHLDKNEYEIFAFVLRISNSSQELQYKDCYNHIIEISPSEIAQSVVKIREADLDILLIGTNVTALANHNALITSHRLARIQAVHFCNPCTTGIKNIDYFITGKNFDLNQQDFTEKLIYTKHSGVCFEGNTIVKPATLELTRTSLGIPDNSIAFITGANFYKLTWELREFWANLLKQIPNSCLLIFPFGPAWTDKYPVNEFKNSVHTQFYDLGVEPSRLIISKALPAREDIRKAVGLCDIYLDSFPYSGATSLLDPLYTSTPVVCMKTNTIRGGQGSAMLEDMGLTELIATNKNEYSAIAIKLAQDIDYRRSISTIIKEKMDNNPPFINTLDYCRDIDRIYKQMLAEYDQPTNVFSFY